MVNSKKSHMLNDDSQAQVEVNVESDLYYEQVLKLYRLCYVRIGRRLHFLLLDSLNFEFKPLY